MIRILVAAGAILVGGLSWAASYQPGDVRIDPRDVRVCSRPGCVAGGDALQTKADAPTYRKDVFIGGAGAKYRLLADPANVPQMLANGRIGLYQHAIGTYNLSLVQRQAIWATWGLDNCGRGETVGEVGGGVANGTSTAPDSGYLFYACHTSPGEVNSNETVAGGTGTYTGASTDTVPGKAYSGYVTASDLATLKGAIDYYMAHGAANVGVFMSPNNPGADFDDPFATSPFWANQRAVWSYGGAVALDVPPSYAYDREPAYRSMIVQMIKWGRSQNLRVSLAVPPYATRPDSHGNSGTCGYDPAYEINTRRFASFLLENSALPTQWDVEAYPDSTSCTINDVGVDGQPGTLNAVALFLANAIPQQSAGTVAPPGGKSEAAKYAVRISVPRLADLRGVGSMAYQNMDDVFVSHGTIGGDTQINTTATPLFQNGLLVQGGTSAFYMSNTAINTLSISQPSGAPTHLALLGVGGAPSMLFDAGAGTATIPNVATNNVNAASGLTVGPPVDSSHPAADGGNSANNLGTGQPTQDCPTSTQVTTSFLCIRGATGATAHQNYAVNINLDSYVGATPDPVALYAGVRSHSGSPGVWGINSVTHLEPGSRAGIGYEADVNNWACDGGGEDLVPKAAGCTLYAPPLGLLVTGSSPYPSGTALKITGVSTANAQWHYGISMIGGHIVDQASIYTNNASPNDYLLKGAHAVGIEMSQAAINGAAIHFAEGHNLFWTNPTNPSAAHNFVVDATGYHLRGPTGLGLDVDNAGNAAPSNNLNLSDGKLVCWPGGNCITYQVSTSKFIIGSTNPDNTLKPLASLNSQTGNLTVLGTVTQNSAP